MRIQLLVLALVLPAFLGCLGGDEGGADEDVTKARAEVTADLGGIEGTVTDPAIQPVVDATVRLVELEQNTTTAGDGSFAFSKLEPGTYTLEARAEGFIPSAQEVQVTSGSVSVAEFIITQRFTEEPYTQQFELAGFFECGVAAGVDASQAPPPANVSTGIISYPVCGDVNDQSGNATNDRFEHFIQIDGPVQGLVVETVWNPGTGSLSDQLWVDIVPEGFHCGSIDTCNWSFIDHWGPSPLIGQIDRERFESIQDYFIEQCKDGEDEWCGYSFFDDGWPLWLRVYPRWECQPTGVQACVLAQQEFTHYVTAFFHQEVPDGYSLSES